MINQNKLDTFYIIRDAWKFSKCEINICNNNIYIVDYGDFSKNHNISKYLFYSIKNIKFFKHVYLTKSQEIITQKNLEKEKITEYFYTDDFSEEYNGLPLNDWLQIYLNLKSFSKFKDQIIKMEKLIEVLNMNLSKQINEEFIKRYIVFNKESKDLYDSPVICSDNLYIVNSEIINYIDISRVLISQLGFKKDNDLNKKGKNFEKYISSLFDKKFNLVHSNVKIHNLNENSEVDLVYEYDDELYILETKTQLQPENHFEQAKNDMELEKYINKFKKIEMHI